MNEANSEILNYSEFWNRNLQQIEDIKQSLILSINRLEKNQPDFEFLYDEIIAKINLLSSIYSSLNEVKGGDYVLKLKALMTEYKKNYNNGKIDFNIISFIIDKISAVTEESIENFPAIQHKLDSNPPIVKITIDPEKEIKHKWLTFEKNGSWFILKYNDIKILKNSESIIEKDIGGGSLEISYGNEIYICKNIFPNLNSPEEKNNYYIIPDSGRKNFSATRTGKRIYSKNDFISSKIKKFRKSGTSGLSPGRVKLFGKSHIVLN